LPNKSVHNKRMVQVLGMLTTNIGLKFEDNNQASECLSKLAWSFWLFEIASPSIRFCSLSLHVQFLPNLIESRFLLAFSNKVCANECTRANENVICARKHKTSLTSRHATFAAPNAHCNVFDLVELLCLVLLRMVFFAAWVVPMVHWCIHQLSFITVCQIDQFSHLVLLRQCDSTRRLRTGSSRHWIFRLVWFPMPTPVLLARPTGTRDKVCANEWTTAIGKCDLCQEAECISDNHACDLCGSKRPMFLTLWNGEVWCFWECFCWWDE